MKIGFKKPTSPSGSCPVHLKNLHPRAAFALNALTRT